MNAAGQALPHATYGAVFGRVLADKRRAVDKEQGEVAGALGVSQSTYSRIERGGISLSLDMLVRIAEFFRVPPSSLVGEADYAANALRNVGVRVVPDRSLQNGDVILALLGGAALATLMSAALAKK
ncbi:helix-turn-helix domain-containing protein [Hyphococcus sp.]|uniref:helix-turn-helix domain-containing protein n=1 Tax=Hyphococcus sp. TaxID=2038636 RepID=UPI00208A392C|nr:MAG: hypothetical protein DHS20C04_09140 [Marinicaulis sp.]